MHRIWINGARLNIILSQKMPPSKNRFQERMETESSIILPRQKRVYKPKTGNEGAYWSRNLASTRTLWNVRWILAWTFQAQQRECTTKHRTKFLPEKRLINYKETAFWSIGGSCHVVDYNRSLAPRLFRKYPHRLLLVTNRIQSSLTRLHLGFSHPQT